jgi:hypothetical protein
LVRVGFVARAVTYGVIAALGLAVAVGAGGVSATPNQQGALAVIARAPLGRLALIVIAAGLLCYALWKLTQGIFGSGPEGGGGDRPHDRIANLSGGLAYLVFFAISIRVLTGTSGSGSSEPSHATAGVLAWPGGQLLVGVAGALLIAISASQIYEAIRGRFVRDSKLEQMSARERRAFLILGRVGLIARALVFVLIGYFLIRAAVGSRSANAVGIDGALARLHRQPLGPWLLGFVAAGLLTFAAFSLLEARYRRL